MEVYIEYVIIDNFVIDAVIAVLTLKALKLSVKWWRVLLAAALGTVAALLLPLINLHISLMLIIKTLTGAAMAFLIYNHKSFKRYFICFIIFMLMTFLLGGTCMGILFLTGSDFSAAVMLEYSSSVPIGLVVLTICACVFFIRQLCVFLHKAKDISGFMREAELFVNGQSIRFQAFIDSGNQIYDSATGLPVIIVESTLIMSLLKNTLLDSLVGGGKPKLKSTLKNAHKIEYSALNGVKKQLTVFKPDKLVIYSGEKENIIYDVMAGLYDGVFDKPVKYSALLHPAII